jgi:hypothetical protein
MILKKWLLLIVTGFVVLIVIFSVSLLFPAQKLYGYSSNIYSIKADSVIRNLYINGTDISAKYQVFQCEENYHQLWKLETPKRISAINNNTLLTYSSLYTFDLLETFTFREDGFTANISKTYTVSSFDENNQIIVDVKNAGWVYIKNTSFRFLLPGWTLENPTWSMTITILYSNTPISFQPPMVSNPTELQFDFREMSDRDIAYHKAGDIETVLFDVTITKDKPGGKA